ncbi:MAG: hypothetical protein ACW980_22545 [Promethearchaeota archaeon]
MLNNYADKERHDMIIKGETETERLVKIEWWYLFIVNKANIQNFERKYGKPKYHTMKDIEELRENN